MESMEEYKKRMNDSIENLDINEFKRSLYKDRKQPIEKQPIENQQPKIVEQTKDKTYTSRQSNQILFLATVLSSAAFFISFISLALHYDKFVSFYAWLINTITKH